MKRLISLFEKPDNLKVKTSYKLEPSIQIERQLAEQIYNALQGPVVEEVMRKIRISSSDAYWRSNMEGHSLKVDQELLPDIYELCHEVKNKLGFEGKVDFYITGDSTVNAFSVASEDENEPNIVNINSGLFDLMSKDELRFVIGHELGHLINKDTALARLIGFVFPPETKSPVMLQYKIRLHDQLAELVADRYGYMAIENLGVCVTAFFKMASGLDLEKMNVSIDALIADNQKRLDYFLHDKGTSRASHPSELDEYTARFVASAGLIVANADGEINKDEVDDILTELSSLKIFPRQFLEEIANGDVSEIFHESVAKMININPGLREAMLNYLITIVMSDKSITKEEIDLLYEFGESIALSEMEVAQCIAALVQQRFIPSHELLC